MFESISPVINTYEEDTRPQKIRRALVGALYGLLAGTAFVLMSAFIDLLFYPDLPLGVDWSLVAVRWLLIGLGLALIGGLTCFFSETWAGLLAGAVAAGLLALTSALFFSPTTAALKLIVLLFTLVPVAAMSLPIAWIFRRLAERHAHALQLKQPATGIAGLVLIAVILGAGFGYFAKMSPSAVKAIRYLHENLQTIETSLKQELKDLPGLHEHAGMEYKLFQKESDLSTEGYDVRAEYEDGYIVQCVVVVYPGSSPYLSSCESSD
jgi:hypothetical protein